MELNEIELKIEMKSLTESGSFSIWLNFYSHFKNRKS